MDYESTMTVEQKETAKLAIKLIGVEGLTINELFADLAEFTRRYDAKIEITEKAQPMVNIPKLAI